MILINFAHPLSEAHLAQVEALVGQKVARVVKVSSQVDVRLSLAAQVARMADEAGLSGEQWQNEALLINPPSLNHSAVLLMAELHGRMGHFPTCMRMRPVPDSVPSRFEVAEVVSLQALRDGARTRRTEGGGI